MEIFKEFTFEAAHRLPNVPAGHKCARLHGHSFNVSVHIVGPVGDDSGWVRDFADLTCAMRPVLDQLDHYYLNEIDGTGEPHQRGAGALDLGPSAPRDCPSCRRLSCARRARRDACIGVNRERRSSTTRRSRRRRGAGERRSRQRDPRRRALAPGSGGPSDLRAFRPRMGADRGGASPTLPRHADESRARTARRCCTLRSRPCTARTGASPETRCPTSDPPTKPSISRGGTCCCSRNRASGARSTGCTRSRSAR